MFYYIKGILMCTNRMEERCALPINRPNDDRTPWQRDYARLIHSAAFRRLQSKTQVLGLGESDFYRTRLTHSMEVSQIGTSITRRIKNPENREYLPDEALITAICLAHDIGHPPFGHGGEVALNYCMLKYGGFEGNGQTLRILSKLEKYSQDCGLNATRRMLLGILKYPISYNECLKENQQHNSLSPSWLFIANDYKPPKCYLDSEKEIVQWILQPFNDDDQNLFTEKEEDTKYFKSKFKSLDTSIMELADDISYGIHDLEDAISLKMITRDMMEEINSEVFSNCGLEKDNIYKELFSKKAFERKNCIGRLVNEMVSNIIIEEVDSNFSSYLLKYNTILKIDFETLRKSLHDIVINYVIKSTNVQLLEFKGQKIVVELFDVIQTDPTRFLPETQKNNYTQATSEADKKRVICDYIAGMTDEYATRLYDKIFNTHRGSVFDRL